MKKFATTFTTQLGTNAENLFQQCLTKGNFTFHKSNTYHNSYHHIDFHIKYIFDENSEVKMESNRNNNQIDVDVKGLKRLSSRPGFSPQSSIIPVEIEKVDGINTKSGWLYDGKAQYIAFQLHANSIIKSLEDKFLLVSRTHLISFFFSVLIVVNC